MSANNLISKLEFVFVYLLLHIYCSTHIAEVSCSFLHFIFGLDGCSFIVYNGCITNFTEKFVDSFSGVPACGGIDIHRYFNYIEPLSIWILTYIVIEKSRFQLFFVCLNLYFIE